ncbi:MAG: hypothetical protein ACPL3P_07495 [Anaerolineales bacterium]
MDDSLLRKYSGVSNKVILENLRQLAELGSNIIIRFPLIPVINESLEPIRQLASLIKCLPNIHVVELLLVK